MAMISCPRCGEQVSDKAKKCVHCGEVLIPEEKKYCTECGAEIDEGVSVCPHCGCPVEDLQKREAEDKPQKVQVTGVKVTKKIKIIIGIIVVFIIIGGATGAGVSHYQKVKEAERITAEEKAAEEKAAAEKAAEEKAAAEKAAAEEAAAQQAALEYAQLVEEYENNLNSVINTMIQGAGNAETAGNLLIQVWYNAIWENSDEETDKYTKPDGYFVSDFNDAIDNLFADSSFSETINGIKENQDEVNSMMKQLNNPPEEYKDVYNAVSEFYNAYISLTNCAIYPTGNYNTFMSTFNDADTNTANAYKALEVYFQ